MPWTYDPSELATSTVYQVRAEIQDTNPNDPQLLDEEIAFAVSQERNFWAAAARCAEMIGRRVIRKADVRLGRSMQVTYTKMAQQYLQMASALRAKSMGTVAPYVGGMIDADKAAIEANTSLIAPHFTRSMMENPWVGGYTTDSLSETTNAPAVDRSDSDIL